MKLLHKQYVSKSHEFQHAATVCVAGNDLLCAWFGGKREFDSGNTIRLSRWIEGAWTQPAHVANGGEYACWNPVLFARGSASIILFYQIGSSPRSWWSAHRVSYTNGLLWGDQFPTGKFFGPVRTPPVWVHSNLHLVGTSVELNRRKNWSVHVEFTEDFDTWYRSNTLEPRTINAIQPTLLVHGSGGGDVQMLCRTTHGFIAQAFSDDNGAHWSDLKLTDMPNPNSAIHAIQLKDGRFILCHNPVTNHRPDHDYGPRTPLVVSVGDEHAANWRQETVLEDDSAGSFSYPTMVQDHDGLLHIVYTDKPHGIKHAIVKP